MKSTFGKNIRITIFGGSHEDHIGVNIEGMNFLPEDVDMKKLQAFLQRRAPGNSPYTTPRKEDDIPVLTAEDPITYIIKNKDRRSGDYKKHVEIPRPGHADYGAWVKYRGDLNMAGGGPFSGRMTAPLCIAGGIALQLLEKRGISIEARLTMAGGFTGEDIYPAILKAKEEGDSLGGLITAKIIGCPAGIGAPMYDGLESLIAPIIFGIPGVKGLSFGSGFRAVEMRGSVHNDPFRMKAGKVVTETNHAGGILGGITTGMDITLEVAFKPTSSIAKEQNSVNLRTGENTTIKVEGRHDPCIAVRAVPVVEAALALAMIDATAGEKIETGEKGKGKEKLKKEEKGEEER